MGEDLDDILGAVDLDEMVASATHATKPLQRSDYRKPLPTTSTSFSAIPTSGSSTPSASSRTYPANASAAVPSYATPSTYTAPVSTYKAPTPSTFAPSANSYAGSSELASSRSMATSDNQGDLEASIQATRAKLRRVREECDDASLDGAVPYELEQQRDALEAELASKITALHARKVSAASQGPSLEQLQDSIKDIRAKLRRVREECDDAYLMGEVPDELEAERTKLEQSLAHYSKLYRDARTGSTSATPTPTSVPTPAPTPRAYVSPTPAPTPRAYVSPTAPYSPPSPRYSSNNNYEMALRDTGGSNQVLCKCGRPTTAKKVVHGQNAGRLYNSCESCGFHNWADGGSSTNSSSSFQSNPMHDFNATTSAPLAMEADLASKMKRAKHILRDVFGHSSFRPGQERVVQVTQHGPWGLRL